jgi:hypothetical protein
MPSPFPGMDPYLEEPSLWPDFHGTMLVAIRAALNSTLPPRYTAFLDRYVWLEEADAANRVRLGKPDVSMTDRGTPAPAGGSGVATVPAPAMIVLPAVRRQGTRYLRIVDRRNRRVVAVLELLSPSNKEAGPEREAYLTKRNEYLATGTNLVEIDLLRAGQRLPLGDPLPAIGAYYVLVSRASEFPNAALWPFGVRDPLPPVPVPLDPDDAFVSLDLKPCLDRAYDEGRYADELPYARPPTPPLREPDATWARQLLADLPSGDPP